MPHSTHARGLHHSLGHSDQEEPLQPGLCSQEAAAFPTHQHSRVHATAMQARDPPFPAPAVIEAAVHAFKQEGLPAPATTAQQCSCTSQEQQPPTTLTPVHWSAGQCTAACGTGSAGGQPHLAHTGPLAREQHSQLATAAAPVVHRHQQVSQSVPTMLRTCSWGSSGSSTHAWHSSRRVLLLLCTLLTLVGSSSSVDVAGGSPQTAAPMPRVALVSEKAFHLEVLAGFITMLEQDYGKHLTVYLHPLNFENRDLDFGFSEFLQASDQDRMRAAAWRGIPKFDVAIFISPEYRVPYVRDFLRQAQPKVVIMMIHNGDAETLPALMPLHPNIHFMTLSPHVQKYVEARLNITLDWMLPLKALKPRTECAEDRLAECLSGFAIQGAMDSRRRNYGSIFTQLDKLINSSETYRADDRLKINVVGSGKPEKLGVPPHLEGRIQPHINLRFQDFYELIHGNFALLPALASEAYYDRKFSSTLITSLVTSVPVVVDERFLQSYTFLSDDHVIRQVDANDTSDAIVRLLDSKSSELAAVRRNVALLREQLSQRALNILKQLIAPVMPQIIADYQQRPW